MWGNGVPLETSSSAAHPHLRTRKGRKPCLPCPAHQVLNQKSGQWGEDGAGAQWCETETPAGRAAGDACPAPGLVAQNGLTICNLFVNLEWDIVSHS